MLKLLFLTAEEYFLTLGLRKIIGKSPDDRGLLNEKQAKKIK